MTDDLFTGDPGDTTHNEVKIDDLVGEGKKFKSIEDLARGKLEADRFIEKLKSETAELRAELNTRIGLTEFLDKLETSKNAQNTNQPNEGNQTSQGGENASALTPEQIEKLLDEKLTQKERQRQASENLRVVKQKLESTFGTNYVNKLNETADTLGVSKDYLNNLAATSPQAFFRLMGVDQRREESGLFSPPSSQTRPALTTGTTERTKAYYDDLKRKDPRTYWDTRTQVQMHKDAVRLGEKFFT